MELYLIIESATLEIGRTDSKRSLDLFVSKPSRI
jgi:hypothetical protein